MRPLSKHTRSLAVVVATATATFALSGCTIDKERFGSSGESLQTSTLASSAPEAGSEPGSQEERTNQRKPDPTQAAPKPDGKPDRPAPGGEVSTDLEAAVRRVQDQFSGQLGLAISSPGGGQSATPIVFGSLEEGPAWSTAKVPVAIAAARNGGVTPAMRSAITVSDNAAADSVWRSLGSADQAGAAATAVLREGGDHVTTIQTAVTRPGFSAFGQTRWSLANQAIFGANLRCITGGRAVAELMGQIAAGQDYGLGTLPGAHFKGGWGPDGAGGYLTRQFGFIAGDKPGTFVGVAIAAKPADGSYETGQAMLTELAKSLTKLRGYAGSCAD